MYAPSNHRQIRQPIIVYARSNDHLTFARATACLGGMVLHASSMIIRFISLQLVSIAAYLEIDLLVVAAAEVVGVELAATAEDFMLRRFITSSIENA
jgi:hypothetical protein